MVLPVGAGAKEHGLHLPLGNDQTLAEALADRVCALRPVLVLPCLPYAYYPAFTAYPGSTTLTAETMRDVVVEVCRSLMPHGARRFYALNTGLSTKKPLAAAAAVLAHEGVTLAFTDLAAALAPLEEALCAQPRGSHADEVETSMMLLLAPGTVRLDRAVPELAERTPGQRFVRSEDEAGTYSPSGAWGDPTLATREKGEAFVDAVIRWMCADLDALRAGVPPPR